MDVFSSDSLNSHVLTHTLLLQPQAREKAQKEGFEISVAKTSFKANTKALAENEGEGLAKVILFIIFHVKIFSAEAM